MAHRAQQSFSVSHGAALQTLIFSERSQTHKRLEGDRKDSFRAKGSAREEPSEVKNFSSFIVSLFGHSVFKSDKVIIFFLTQDYIQKKQKLNE